MFDRKYSNRNKRRIPPRRKSRNSFFRRLLPQQYRNRKSILSLSVFFLALLVSFTEVLSLPANIAKSVAVPRAQSGSEIKWVDFDVPYEALDKAMNLDIESYGSDIHLSWIDTLAYLAARYGGDFSSYRSSHIDEYAERIRAGEAPEEAASAYSLYDFYLEAYTAVLGGFLGEYEIQVAVTTGEAESETGSLSEPGSQGLLPKESGFQTGDAGSQTQEAKSQPEETGFQPEMEMIWKKTYGLKAFSPIAAGYWYNDYDDFGSGRSYGFARTHLGHDLMVSTGTPVVAVESGVVEALGWNQYGGWRIGIRSLDGRRYYYYAHLRKDHPYAAGLYTGKIVTAGDVIAYSGQTGYSIKENVNNIDTPHLHYGMQLIFNEAEKDSPNQIWIDLYAITRLLSGHRADVVQDPETREFSREYPFRETDRHLVMIEEQIHGEPVAEYPNSSQTFSGQAEEDGGSSSTVSGAITDAIPGNPEEAADSKSDAEAAAGGQVMLPIVMYHSLLKDPSRQNEFTIDPSQLEADLKYLNDRGYQTVLMSDVISYLRDEKELPEKPIVLTFDDGHYNNYYYGFPLFEKYDAKAVISVIGSLTDRFSEEDGGNANYSYLTWDEINELIASGRIEIQNHSYDMHGYSSNRRGSMKSPGESSDAYQAYFKNDLLKMQNRTLEKTGWSPNTYTYPYGLVQKESLDYVKELGFDASLGCEEGVNYLPIQEKDENILYNMKRIKRPNNISSESFFQKYHIE